jgi:ABC-type phosphate transport system permease subunit
VATRELPHAVPQLRAARRRWGEDLIKGVLALCAFVSVATTVGIVVALFLPAIDFFRDVSIWDYLTGTEWTALFTPPVGCCRSSGHVLVVLSPLVCPLGLSTISE